MSGEAMSFIRVTDRPVREDRPEPVVFLVLFPDARKRSGSPSESPNRPAWFLLYALIPSTVGLFLLAERIPEWSVWRPLVECAALVLILGAALAWIRGNRLSLTYPIGQAESLQARSRGALQLTGGLPAPASVHPEATLSGPSRPLPEPASRSASLS
jgi:hypothetical protein